MRLTLPPLEIGDEEGFNPAKDLFGLATVGHGLINLLTKVEEPLVIALDGQWGSGKSTFLKMWAGELRKEHFPTIYFDAFENDYVDDAFGALAREVAALIESKQSTGEAAAQTFIKNAISVAKLFAKAAAKVAVNVTVHTATAGLVSNETISGAISAATDATSDAAEQYMEDLLTEPAKQKDTVDAFRTILSELPALLEPPEPGSEQKPLVFIIDELDRCKPLFALELLERIKHFMSVPNVHFVLGVHVGQLCNSVRVAYGSEMDAETYLQKFINLTVSLPSDDAEDRRGTIPLFVQKLNRQLLSDPDDPRLVELMNEFVVRIARSHDWSFRTLERVYTNVAVCMAYSDKRQHRVGPIIAGLCILKVTRPDLYAKAQRGRLTYEDAAGAFAFAPVPDGAATESDWARGWWRACLAESITPDLEEYGRGSFRFSMNGDRSRWIPHFCRAVVDRFLF